jgi:pimeloyl-ACP methyl ester carboxylesterase
MRSEKGLVHFAHGKESGPWGVKILRLAKVAKSHGYAIESLDYSGITSPHERLEKLLRHQVAVENLILVGSSLGGYVVTAASRTLSPKGLFLLAPAFHIAGYESEDLRPKAQFTTIVHGWRDEIISPENSYRFAEKHQTQLHIINGDHRLNDQIDLIEILFELFLKSVEAASK